MGMFKFKQNAVCGVGREQAFILRKKNLLIITFAPKSLVQSDVYITFSIFYIIKIFIFLKVFDNLLKIITHQLVVGSFSLFQPMVSVECLLLIFHIVRNEELIAQLIFLRSLCT